MAGTIGYRDQVAPAPDKSRRPRHDIRKFIAASQTKQMDLNEFPPYEYRRYPLMPLDTTGKPYLDAAGRSLVLLGPDDEDAFYEDHPDAPRIRDPIAIQDELAELRAENARLKATQNGHAPPEKGDEEKVAAPPAKNGVAGLTKAPPKPKLGSKLE